MKRKKYALTAGISGLMFAVVGLVQWIRRKSIWKVDREILALGGLYLIVIGLCVLFELAVVNYRAIIMPGSTHPEASFPSSHTMMVCVILGSAMLLLDKYVKQKKPCALLRVYCAAIIVVTIFGRLISGVRWFTDVPGGILIGVILLNLYTALLERMKTNE